MVARFVVGVDYIVEIKELDVGERLREEERLEGNFAGHLKIIS